MRKSLWANSQSKAHLQRTQSYATEPTLQKSLAFLPTHGKHPKFDKDYQIWIDSERRATHNIGFGKSGA